MKKKPKKKGAPALRIEAALRRVERMAQRFEHIAATLPTLTQMQAQMAVLDWHLKEFEALVFKYKVAATTGNST